MYSVIWHICYITLPPTFIWQFIFGYIRTDLDYSSQITTKIVLLVELLCKMWLCAVGGVDSFHFHFHSFSTVVIIPQSRPHPKKMNMKAIIKPLAQINYRPEENEINSILRMLFTQFPEFCGYWGICNVFALIKQMFSLKLVQWEKEESKRWFRAPENMRQQNSVTCACLLCMFSVCACNMQAGGGESCWK